MKYAVPPALNAKCSSAGSADTCSFQDSLVDLVQLAELRPQQPLEVPLVLDAGPAERGDERGEPGVGVGRRGELPQVGQQQRGDTVAGQLVVHLHRGSVAVEHRPGAQTGVVGVADHLGQSRRQLVARHRVRIGDLGGQLGHRISWEDVDGTGVVPVPRSFHA